MTAARRLAAILAGYSRLMGEDEAGTARAVAIATSTVTIFNDRITSTPVMRRGKKSDAIERQSYGILTIVFMVNVPKTSKKSMRNH
jgi:hypothetical protein